MNKKILAYLLSSMISLVLISACANKPDSESSNLPENQPAKTNQSQAAANSDDSTSSDEEIYVIIDQSEKPITGNSFDFVVNKIPEGYALSEMEWLSDKNQIVNTVQQAIEHGGNGEDGFYISGDGQFSGFFYPDEMKSEQGEVILRFKNEQGKELSWSKKITLK